MTFLVVSVPTRGQRPLMFCWSAHQAPLQRESELLSMAHRNLSSPACGLLAGFQCWHLPPCYSYAFYKLTLFFPAFALCTFQKFLERSPKDLSFILLTKSSSFFKDKFKSHKQNGSLNFSFLMREKSSFLPLRFCITSCMFSLTSGVTPYTLTYQSLPLVLWAQA